MTQIPPEVGVWGIHGDIRDTETPADGSAALRAWEDMYSTTGQGLGGLSNNPTFSGMPVFPDHTLVIRHDPTQSVAWGYDGDANGWPFGAANVHEFFFVAAGYGFPALPTINDNWAFGLSWGMGSGLVGRRAVRTKYSSTPGETGKVQLLDAGGSIIATSAAQVFAAAAGGSPPTTGWYQVVLWVDTYWNGTDIRTRLYVNSDAGGGWVLALDDISHTAGEVHASVLQVTNNLGYPLGGDNGMAQNWVEPGLILRTQVAPGDYPRDWAVGKYQPVANGSHTDWTVIDGTLANWKNAINESGGLTAGLYASAAGKSQHTLSKNVMTGWTVSSGGSGRVRITLAGGVAHGMQNNQTWVDVTGGTYFDGAWKILTVTGDDTSFELSGSTYSTTASGTITRRDIPSGNTVIAAKFYANLYNSARIPDGTNLKHLLTDGTDYSYDADSNSVHMSSHHLEKQPSTGLRWTPATLDALTDVGLQRVNSESPVSITSVTDNGSGKAQFNKTAHGLAPYRTVLIAGYTGAYAAYNGLWRMGPNGANSFECLNNSSASLSFIAGSATGTPTAVGVFRVSAQSRLMVYSISNPSLPPVGKSLQLRQAMNRAAVI